MNNQARYYLDGMLLWGELRRPVQVWLLVNHPDFCPSGAWLDFMAE